MDRFHELITTRTGLMVVLAILVVMIIMLLVRRNRSEASAINLDDLLLGDDGKMSKAACVMLGAFLLTSWQLVYMTLQSKWTEGYAAIYVAAWITPVVAKLIKGNAA